MIFAAAVLTASSVFAQSKQCSCQQNGDSKDMVQRRTDRMAKMLGLSADQTARLMELNKAHADKMPSKGDKCRGCKQGSEGQKADGVKSAQPLTKEQAEARAKERALDRAEYQAGLKKILTDEQFAKFQEMKKQGRKDRGGKGMRRGQNDRHHPQDGVGTNDKSK